MYVEYWGLREEPFQNSNDPRFVYLADQHREGLARLLYLARGRKLGGVLVGPYGVGKSMVLELLADAVRREVRSRFVKLDAPTGGTAAFVRQLLRALGHERPTADVADALQLLGSSEARSTDAPAHTVLAIDEAQMIRDRSTLEFLHLLTNLRVTSASGSSDPSFTLVLSGHDRLLDSLVSEPALWQRLHLIWRLEPLDERQTAEYVRHRLAVAGAVREVFDTQALTVLYVAGKGLPRMINNVADLALMIGAAMRVPLVSAEVARMAAAELRVPEEPSMAEPAAKPPT